ncbi:MAG: hypothetical protein ACXWWC_02835 [Chitinophagaceae bacterium]
MPRLAPVGGDEKLLQQSKIILANKTFEKKLLCLAVANTMDKTWMWHRSKNDSSGKTVLIGPILVLRDFIYTNKQNQLKFYGKF